MDLYQVSLFFLIDQGQCIFTVSSHQKQQPSLCTFHLSLTVRFSHDHCSNLSMALIICLREKNTSITLTYSLINGLFQDLEDEERYFICLTHNSEEVKELFLAIY